MNELLNLRELAIKLSLPVEWLAGQAESGDIPCLKVGEKLLFNLGAVKSALAEQAAVVTIEPRKPEGESYEKEL